MRALAWIGVLVQESPVKEGQAVFVPGKMGRHPVQNHANVRLMTGIDKGHEFIWRAMSAGCREVAGNLIAPGTVVGMLGYRKQFDVRVAHLLNVGYQIGRKFRVG